jgi:hypothetical protein
MVANKEMKMRNRIESALIVAGSLIVIGGVAIWGAWSLACMAI